MAKKKKGAQKSSTDSGFGRVRRLTRRQKRNVAKKGIRQNSKMAGSFRLVGQVKQVWRQHWKVLGGIVLVYLVLNIIFASGISNINGTVSDIKSQFEATGGHHFWSALGGFGSLVGSAGTSGSQTSSVLQSVLIVIESLVIIWALRHLLAGKKIGIKEAYYKSMAPFIPFLLVILVIFIQLLPVTFGGGIVYTILSAIFNTGTLLSVIFIFLFLLLATWSVYMLCSSVFALYIVTLPDMQPRRALRSAKNLVRFRRSRIIRRLLFLPLVILFFMAAIIIPLILWATFLVTPVFYVLSMLSILFVHTYLYNLYRSMLD